jgi:hypothetical protein
LWYLWLVVLVQQPLITFFSNHQPLPLQVLRTVLPVVLVQVAMLKAKILHLLYGYLSLRYNYSAMNSKSSTNSCTE